MYFDWRLFGLTRGVRLRIVFAAALGLIAVGAGVARLAVSGVVIYRVLAGQASFSALALPLSIIAALIVVRSLFQYWQNSVSHHTANIVKIRLRHDVYEHALKLGPGYFDRNRTGDVVLTLVETEDRGPPPLEWLALLATVMLAAGGFLAYARPRRRALAGPDPGLGREALILEVARIDDALAEAAEPDTRSEILERRGALLSLLRKSD